MMIFKSRMRNRKGATTSFADFIRNADSEKKKRVYGKVLIEATKQQNQVILEASSQ